MESGHKRAILENMDFISEAIKSDCDFLLEVLALNQVLSREIIEEIKKGADVRKKTVKLLETLCFEGNRLTFTGFLEAMNELGMHNVIGKLEDYFMSLLGASGGGDELDSRRDETDSQKDSQRADGSCSSQSPNPIYNNTGNYESQFLVKPASYPVVGDDVYKMTAQPRGFCIIVNNIVFPEGIQERIGAESEAEYLKDIFRQCGFVVKISTNKSVKEMTEMFEEQSKLPEMKNHDCLIIFIMSHGNRGHVMGSDSKYIGIEHIVGLFNNHNCPNLQHKPKLFFIQACRGENFDYGTTDFESSYDAVPNHPSPLEVPFNERNLPTWSDTLIVYSTMDGYVSLRNENTGSWFGEALGRTIIDHAHDNEIHNLLIKVNNKVNDREGITRVKQTPEVIYRGWRKNFYFNPGF